MTASRRFAALGVVAAAVALGARIPFVLRSMQPGARGMVWPLVALASLMMVAAFGISRRSVGWQVGARGIVWLTLLPAAGSVISGTPISFALGVMIVGSALGLGLAWPALYAARADHGFAPAAFRRSFLLGAVASVTLAGTTGLHAVSYLAGGAPMDALPLIALAVAALAGAWGVLHLRAWGAFVGIAASIAACARSGSRTAAALDAGIDSVVLAWTVLPALAFGVPLAVSWRRVRGRFSR